jgi:hypothetical protein
MPHPTSVPDQVSATGIAGPVVPGARRWIGAVVFGGVVSGFRTFGSNVAFTAIGRRPLPFQVTNHVPLVGGVKVNDDPPCCDL